VPDLPQGQVWRLSNKALEALLRPPEKATRRQESALLDAAEVYVLESTTAHGWYLTVQEASTAVDAPIVLGDRPHVTHAQWRVAHEASSDTYSIESLSKAGRYVGVAAKAKAKAKAKPAGRGPGHGLSELGKPEVRLTSIVLTEDPEAPSSRWRLSGGVDHSFSFESLHSPGLCLSATDDPGQLILDLARAEESPLQPSPLRWRALKESELPRELPFVLANRGAVPRHLPGREGERDGEWVWIRKQNDEKARAERRVASALTRQCTAAGGYVLDGSRIELNSVEDMCSRTRVLAPSLGNVAPPGQSPEFPETGLRRMPQDVFSMQAAELLAKEECHQEGRGVAVVSAASAYHCGGGFLTGGRHALEEAICMQTTLHPSIAQARLEALAAAGAEDGEESHFAYIPRDGAVLSPRVELFREGTSQGYPFMQRPVELAAVISVAMFNKNPAVGDAPLDAPEDLNLYEQIVADKFRSVLAAAVSAGASALVMCDVGCGVYMNDPAIVGRVFGEVLYREYWGRLRDVALCGKVEFQATVEKTVQRLAEAAALESSDEEELTGFARSYEEDQLRRQREELSSKRRLERAAAERRREEEEMERKRQEELQRKLQRDAEERQRREEEARRREEQNRKEEEARERRAQEAARKEEERAAKAREAEERRQRQQEELAPRQRPQVLQIVVPPGVGPGQAIQVRAPDGQVVQAQVPPGMGPGATLHIQYTPMAPVSPGAAASAAPRTPSPRPSGRGTPVWEFGLANDRWKAFEPDHQQQLERAYTDYISNDGFDFETVRSGSMLIVVNFRDMTQNVQGSDRKRKVRRRE